MPLFMDLHQAADYEVKPTVEEIKRNHIADLEVQSKYGVRFLQYWINEEAGLVFCLMEAPDKESCAAVHREAHGSMPCNVIELKGGDYQVFMGSEERVNLYDIVENAEGVFDNGYRFLLSLDIISATVMDTLYQTLSSAVCEAGGRSCNRPGYRELFAFTSAPKALQSATELMKTVEMHNGIELRIGLSAGQPVTHETEFFGAATQLANSLCTIAQNGQIVISPLAARLCGVATVQAARQKANLKILDTEEEKFMRVLLNSIETRAFEPSFSLDSLCKNIGLSRSGLYRNITGLTGRSANDFIQELRLQKAYHLIRNKQGNITEIAFEAGYGNPSYFTRSFQKRFGVSPVQLLKAEIDG